MKTMRSCYLLAVLCLALTLVAGHATANNRMPKRKPVKSMEEILKETHRRLNDRTELLDRDVRNITILETTASSAYTRSEQSFDGGNGGGNGGADTEDNASTAYLPVNGGDSPAGASDLGRDSRGSAFSQLRVSKAEANQWHRPIHGRRRDRLGLYAQYALVGVVHGLYLTLLYPLLKIYLNADEYRAAAAEALVALPWSCKLLLAWAPDWWPIRGLRKTPYLYLGWGLCGLSALILSCLPREEPYSRQRRTMTNATGEKYIVLIVLATIGIVLVSVTCDGIVVALTHEEPPSRRASLLLGAAAARYAGQAGITFFTALLCNSPAYGGTFGWGASVNGMSIVALLAAIAGAAATRFYLVEHPVLPTSGAPNATTTATSTTKDAIRERLEALLLCLQKRSMWQSMVYVFAARVCFGFYVSTNKALYEYWVTIPRLLDNVFNSINALVYVAAALVIRRSFAEMSWRRLIMGVVAVSVLMTLLPMLFFTWNVLRGGFLLLLIEQLVAVVEAVAYFVLLMVMAEAAEPGLESTTFAMLTTVANVALPFATSLSQSIGAHFDTFDSEWKADTTSVRWKVMYALLVWIVFRALNVAALPLLPDNRKELKALKDYGGSHHRLAALAVCAVAAFLWLWDVLMVMLASFERTACLTVAGGEGC